MTATNGQGLRSAYLDLVKRTITNYAYLGGDAGFDQFRCVEHYDLATSRWKIDPLARPFTLLTRAMLDIIEQAVLELERRAVPGHLLEAGVWRGGAIIFMRALLEAYAIPERKVFAADSFAGIPQNTRATNDPVDGWSDRWAASLEEVGGNIDRMGMLDDRIRFVPGTFDQTLRLLADQRFALIRLDSDSYDSVETSLDYLYPLVSQGGIVLIDDWHLPGCRQAVADYRDRNGIRDSIREGAGNAWWVKSQAYGTPALPQ